MELNPVDLGDKSEQKGDSVSTISLGIDSGAAVTVIPRELAKDYPVTGARLDKGYKIADGTTIPDEGKKQVAVALCTGERRVINPRVTAVHKPLLSVSEMVKSGHDVVFSDKASYAIHRSTKEVTKFHQRRGVYEVDCEIIPYSEAVSSSQALAPVEEQKR